MVSIYYIIGIIFIHWVSDFLLQTQKMAITKSSSNKWLGFHILTYILPWFILGSLLFGISFGFWFSLITAVFHFLTDYISSRITKRLYNKDNLHWFFVTIGFDQFLHYTQLFITFYYLTS